MTTPLESTGLIRVRGHCLFTWREKSFGDGPRTIEITSEHCDECIAEVRRLAAGHQPVRFVDLRRRSGA
jgi:hypothetical protein